MISSLLNVAYLLPIVARGFFINSADDKKENSIKEAPLLCWVPAAIAAVACILLFFYAGLIQDFLLPIVGGSL
jgi:multicomponent Na+:H+ antiporter subunit D